MYTYFLVTLRSTDVLSSNFEAPHRLSDLISRPLLHWRSHLQQVLHYLPTRFLVLCHRHHPSSRKLALWLSHLQQVLHRIPIQILVFGHVQLTLISQHACYRPIVLTLSVEGKSCLRFWLRVSSFQEIYFFKPSSELLTSWRFLAPGQICISRLFWLDQPLCQFRFETFRSVLRLLWGQASYYFVTSYRRRTQRTWSLRS